jgi:hypothetical protein
MCHGPVGNPTWSAIFRRQSLLRGLTDLLQLRLRQTRWHWRRGNLSPWRQDECQALCHVRRFLLILDQRLNWFWFLIGVDTEQGKLPAYVRLQPFANWVLKAMSIWSLDLLERVRHPEDSRVPTILICSGGNLLLAIQCNTNGDHFLGTKYWGHSCGISLVSNWKCPSTTRIAISWVCLSKPIYSCTHPSDQKSCKQRRE